MRSEQLTVDQLARISAALRPAVDYLDRMESRMTELRFDSDDRLYRRAQWANRLAGDLLEKIDSEVRRRESIYGTATRTTGGMR